ncbi:DUF6777 domain-containing protein [Streptomyces pinistramenti]|uniref:DUF6777 domain-containing protein n=1 Tax=Streptomyces pinistramenti TaxID=2884812 RepID=UPI001D0923D0|nr:DUF6777 domain-containing protein [Streptomyces pinistramenti]MCB5912100.1 hypothetical protein [Streptomyces pinistramenti]
MTSPPAPDSDPTEPPAGPSAGRRGGGNSGDGGRPGRGPAGGPGRGPGGRQPWWWPSARLAVAVAVLAAVLVLTVFLTRPGHDEDILPGPGEVLLQPAAAPGPSPFTESTATSAAAAPTPTAPPAAPPGTPPGGTGTVRSVQGSAPGLYGGTRSTASCDVARQIGLLTGDRAKTTAFGDLAGVDDAAVPGYLRALTPVALRRDTRVTNHGFTGGEAFAYQSVLQAGTAVLVDAHGLPRVRCACGNPLTPPVALKKAPATTGEAWPAYRPSDVVVVQQTSAMVDTFVLLDPATGHWFARPRGTTGASDRPTSEPNGTPGGGAAPGA